MYVVVIGGGAAGMMAAWVAASNDNDVLLLDGNDKLGKKLYISGKGRCNITNCCNRQEFLANVVNNSKFLMSAISKFSPDDTIELCESMGCRIKVERGNRVFPISDKASDFIKVLENKVLDNGVEVRYNCRVNKLNAIDGTIVGVTTDNGEYISADKVILATGGMSYPGTGSKGDGYGLAKSVGHSIITPIAALTPIDVYENVGDLAGVSLKNVNCSITDDGGKVLYEEFGEMLFTHTGLSGPIILSLSSKINRMIGKAKLYITIDLKPALSIDQLDQRILRDFDLYKNKELKNSLNELLISSLRNPIINTAGLDDSIKVNLITKTERLSLVNAIKNFRFTVRRLGDIAGAIVTSGGISTGEINPKNMESKIVKGLHFAGEVIDVDALTGGYNIQIALSTGYLAGMNSI